MSDLEVIKTSHPALFFKQAGRPLTIAGKLQSKNCPECFCVRSNTTGSPDKYPKEKKNQKHKKVFAVLRWPVQTESTNEQKPMLPFNPLTYWVALGVAHPSPTHEPRDTPALSIAPFSTYWWQKKVQFTLTFTAPLKGDLQIKKKIKHI